MKTPNKKRDRIKLRNGRIPENGSALATSSYNDPKTIKIDRAKLQKKLEAWFHTADIILMRVFFLGLLIYKIVTFAVGLV